MKSSALIVLCLFSLNLHAQEPAFDPHTWEAPYVLPTPKDWGTERFLIPISFAPEITYKGIEDIRFSPGWAKATSEQYWSYAFLWYLEGEVTLDAKKIESNLKAYYTGLVSANGSKIPADKIIPIVTFFKESKRDKDDLGTYRYNFNDGLHDTKANRPKRQSSLEILRWSQQDLRLPRTLPSTLLPYHLAKSGPAMA